MNKTLTKKQNRIEDLKSKGLQKILAPAALIILYVFFAIFGRNFISYTTLVNILDSSYYIGFIAIGVTFVIITGGIDLSCGTVMMAAAIIGGTAYKSWGWPMWISLLFIVVVGALFGLFNGLLIAKLKLPPFIATMGTMMISKGVGSIVSNVRSATFPTRSEPSGWFKGIFKYITEDNSSIPTGALVLFGFAFISYVILFKTKMGRYIFAIGSNKEAARLSGINVEKWEMSVYIVSGISAGIGGIAFAAVYTTVMPAQGAGFELYAIAGAVIGGTSLSGGIGSVSGTLIGVFIMSVLRTGLPSMDLQSHYQTFFTGVVVILAVLLDIYKMNKASLEKIVAASERYRNSMNDKIDDLKANLESAEADRARGITDEIAALTKERDHTYARMRAEEKAEQARIRREEKLAKREFRKNA
ncbi:MAG: ABC transporter permease [Spirochaetia bacterium]|nr:ABC transporter permease [Spirochaetia bacterium]MCF7940013.1 ABC transporter permease [Spirochaetia bacterium]